MGSRERRRRVSGERIRSDHYEPQRPQPPPTQGAGAGRAVEISDSTHMPRLPLRPSRKRGRDEEGGRRGKEGEGEEGALKEQRERGRRRDQGGEEAGDEGGREETGAAG